MTCCVLHGVCSQASPHGAPTMRPKVGARARGLCGSQCKGVVSVCARSFVVCARERCENDLYVCMDAWIGACARWSGQGAVGKGQQVRSQDHRAVSAGVCLFRFKMPRRQTDAYARYGRASACLLWPIPAPYLCIFAWLYDCCVKRGVLSEALLLHAKKHDLKT